MSVTPYFRKASIISEVGWELQRGFLSSDPPSPKSPQRADTRYLPLQLCYLIRNFRHIDSENRTLELHSPDSVHACVLRASDAAEAAAWFNTLHSALAVLTERALKVASNVLTNILGELRHIGWLSRKPPSLNDRCSSESSEDNDKWQSIFAAITDRELRLYESAPWSIEAWAASLETYPLLSTRLVSSTRQTDSIVFNVRCGTGEGVITHFLRAETHRDLAAWARALVQGAHQCVSNQRELVCRCLYQGQPCQLILHYENGFKLIERGSFSISGREGRVLWAFPFEKLRASADDGARLLWLDFGGEDGEIELDLEACPKPMVFILHNFLSAKIHRLGLIA
ncbi:conserved hypothetical protein [Pediculus humanus corporis]|uniref:PH domain-containing protein n=1 Tax=Pediculus humanus subsp. corporis TaxID=121224 RepID=E0VAU2_PEDHC|nr:uncharacterized protein Phum_PHUM044590 [Pediculus humanus corporis]EEB10498.1 conserved hypothetical protein [Pediculus humanus corporis]